MAFLTKRGARAVTTDLDRIATLFQTQHDVLGIPKTSAERFAFYCDSLSDHIEKYALKLAEENKEESPKEEEVAKKDEPKKEASKSKRAEEEAPKKDEEKKEEAPKKEAKTKKADDETGLSVDHGASGFDANVIGDDVGGPQEIIQPPSEPWMNDFYSQGWFQELQDLQQAGAMSNAAAKGQILTKAAKASIAKLKKMASASKLSSLEDLLKMLHSKLVASSMAEVKALAADVQKQIDALGKVRDACIDQQAVGMIEPAVMDAADKIVQAVSEQIPYLQQVVVGVDGGSPVALLEFQKMVGGSSLKDLVALGASIVVDAAKVVGKKEEPKEASQKLSAEDEALLRKMVAEEEEDEVEKEASEALLRKMIAEEEESDKEEKEESEDKEEESDKTAGYNLFA